MITMNKRKRWILGLVSAVTLAGPAGSFGAKPPSDKGDHVATGGDVVFLDAAASGGIFEVEAGRLARQQAESSEVKELGQMMVTDHSQAGKKLAKLARQKHIPLPSKITPAQQEAMRKLSPLSGWAFDRAYVKTMVQDHRKDVTAFQSTAQNGTDADVKAFAAETLPTLQMHLEKIKAIAARMGLQSPDKKK